jgi:hypothetical protein
VSLFRRREPPPQIYVGDIGTINEGQAIEFGRERGEVGSFVMGRQAKAHDAALARQVLLRT